MCFGSGGLVVMNQSTCMVNIARFFMQFTQNESCGKCTFCRIGTKRMFEILTKIVQGKGEMSDIDKLEHLAKNINQSSLCALGQTAPNPVLTTLRYFKDEYLAHIVDKKCPAKVCKDLISYEIDPTKCIGCTMCTKTCPSKCIEGSVKQPHKIIKDKCIRCSICFNTCKFKAISKIS